MSALEGVRVLDLTRLLPGPYCTLVLADLGARVDKVEEPGAGDYLRHMPPLDHGVSGMFLTLNRDKRSIALDLKKPEGPEVLHALCAGADVLVEGFRPGVLARLGCAPDALLTRHPKLIVCSITGYGQTGPLAHRAGHDIGYLARAGVLGLAGPKGGVPQVPGVQIADIAGGALWGAISILAALLERGRTGRGRHLDVSMTDGANAFLIAALGSYFTDGRAPRAGAEPLTGGLAAYRVYRTKDDRYMSVGALEPKFWMALCQALEIEPDLAGLLPGSHQAAIQARLEEVFARRTRDEWVERLSRSDTCCEPVLDLPETLADPLLQARGLVSGRVVRTPVASTTSGRPAPALGEHTDEILAEAGLSADRIAALRGGGVVA